MSSWYLVILATKNSETLPENIAGAKAIVRLAGALCRPV